jgi:predicted nucleic acid-binding protein
MHLQAQQLRENYCFSFWDSLIVAAALKANCETLYSEDMQDGLLVNKTLRIINPLINTNADK